MAFNRVTLQLDGGPELQRRVDALGPAIGSAMLEAATVQAAQPMLEMARRRVPVSLKQRVSRKTGKPLPHLRDALHITPARWKRKVKGQAKLTYSPAMHGTVIERGAGPHKIRTSWPVGGTRKRTIEHPGIKARPFLLPAYLLYWRPGLRLIQERAWAAVEAAWNQRGAGGGSGKEI